MFYHKFPLQILTIYRETNQMHSEVPETVTGSFSWKPPALLAIEAHGKELSLRAWFVVPFHQLFLNLWTGVHYLLRTLKDIGTETQYEVSGSWKRISLEVKRMYQQEFSLKPSINLNVNVAWSSPTAMDALCLTSCWNYSLWQSRNARHSPEGVSGWCRALPHRHDATCQNTVRFSKT